VRRFWNERRRASKAVSVHAGETAVERSRCVAEVRCLVPSRVIARGAALFAIQPHLQPRGGCVLPDVSVVAGKLVAPGEIVGVEIEIHGLVPTVLSRQEVAQVLAAIEHPNSRMAATTIYATAPPCSRSLACSKRATRCSTRGYSRRPCHGCKQRLVSLPPPTFLLASGVLAARSPRDSLGLRSLARSWWNSSETVE
jgi:hypothetical protein